MPDEPRGLKYVRAVSEESSMTAYASLPMNSDP